MHAISQLLLGDFWLGNLKNEDPGHVHAVGPDCTRMHVNARKCTWMHVEAHGGTGMHEHARLHLITAQICSDLWPENIRNEKPGRSRIDDILASYSPFKSNFMSIVMSAVACGCPDECCKNAESITCGCLHL